MKHLLKLDEDSIIDFLKEKLDEKRLKHSINVMKCAVILAKKFNVDEDNAKFAGLLHDIAKNMKGEELVDYCRKNGIELDEMELSSPGMLHADVGADMAKNLFGVNADIEEAIRYHTLGNAEMTDLDKIIYIADLIEEGRVLPGLDEIRKIAYDDLEKGFIAALKYCIDNVAERGKSIHNQSKNALKAAIDRL